MDYDLIIIPSYIIYALGLQWAWQFNIIFQPLNLGFDSYCDHYIISMINKKWIYHEPIDPETRFHAVFSLISVIHTKNKVLEIVIDGGVNAGWISHAPSSIIHYINNILYTIIVTF